jgi:hypothetical protein
MIVVGLDVHKHSLTAVAVDELGRALAECSGPVDGRVVAWARSLRAAVGARGLPPGHARRRADAACLG